MMILPMNSFVLGGLVVLLPLVNGLAHHHQVKRQVSELRDKYDFVIAGGGTTGLTIADRLTEAFPKSKSTPFFLVDVVIVL